MMAKTWMFIVGLVMLVVSAVGLALNLGLLGSILSFLPVMPALYLGIDAALGLIMIVISLSPQTY